MDDFIIEKDVYDDCLGKGNVLTEYTGKGGKVVVPDNVKYIGVGVFENSVALTEAVIPSGAEIICDCAFLGCINLKRITLPASLKEIGRKAFLLCNSLEHIIFNGTKEQFEDILKCDRSFSTFDEEGNEVWMLDSIQIEYNG